VGASHAADQALVEAARKEGRVTWYTTLIVDQFARPAAAAFEKQYGIKVDYIRADPVEIGVRILAEAQAGRVQADIFDGFGLPELVRAGLTLKWLPDSAKRLPKEYYDGEGAWAASNLYVLTPGFNTNLVPKGTEPKSFADLLDPKWKGRMVWSSRISASTAIGFVGLVLTEMGEEKGTAYLRNLAKQNIVNAGTAARQVVDQVMAGEYAIALQIFNHHTVISANQGAPVSWARLETAFVALSLVQLTANSPHPYAGKLLFDFLISEDGQKLFRDADYMPVDPKVPPRDASLRPDTGGFRATYFTPEQIDKDQPHWVDVYQQIFK
jgi:iron(III) transport system substrate-binding protein